MLKSHLRSAIALVIGAALCLALPGMACAENQTYYLGTKEKAKIDTGYAESEMLKEADPHYGWDLGQFYISGYTAVQRGDDYVFLKTVGDKVSLNFRLDQDINRLNNNDKLSISDDKNGYDQSFDIEKSEPGFGRGTLIVRQTDYQNAHSAPQVYNDYLSGVVIGADTQVGLYEEGDYEVALDYEIKNDVRTVGGLGPIPTVSIAPEYSNYTIRFKFSVRNGNTMVFLFDAENGSELTNESTAPNGFTIDLARSRYLGINVKREVLSGDHFDVRSNAPAADGTEYTDEGIYTITANNPTTGQTTEKIIYVGSDPQLKAYAVNGYSLDQIRDKVSQGAKINDDGSITWPETASEAFDDSVPSVSQASEKGEGAVAQSEEQEAEINPAVVVVAVVVLLGIVFVAAKKRKSRSIADGDDVSAHDGGRE